MGLQSGAANLERTKATGEGESTRLHDVIALLGLLLADSAHTEVTASRTFVVKTASVGHSFLTNITSIPRKEAQLLSFGSCRMASWTKHGLGSAFNAHFHGTVWHNVAVCSAACQIVAV